MGYKMKHDIEFKIGKEYYIDERQNKKKAKVILKHFYPETMIFCTVQNEGGSEWGTMLNRLTEIND